jgi:tetratricopeptide (TPR) repeat protein
MKVGESAVILLLVLSSLGANVVAPTKAEVEAMYAAAAQELNAGNYGEALKKLDAIDARQPDVAAAKNLRGVALMRMGEYGPAEKALQKARELDPNLWEARFNLAEVPFLRKSWAEARDRFQALVEKSDDKVQAATADLIQFKILLTYLLQNKEKNATVILDRLKASSASPAYYYAKAAFAFQEKDETGARINLHAAEKAYSPRLNKLFTESFYEVGWVAKPDNVKPVALEVTSEAERLRNAEAEFRKATSAFRRQDFESALELLDQVDTTAPNQAASYNLRGEILLEEGKEKEAEASFGNALVADPQFQDARYNLARIPFKKRDYAAARKQLEELLGAISGNKQEHHREELIRYEIFLTLLLEGRDGAAQKAMEEFKMMDDTPALYYAQAAWAFQHGNPEQAGNWMANAGNLFSPELNRSFATPLTDLGWLSDVAERRPTPATITVTKASAEPSASAAAGESSPAKGAAIAEASPTPLPAKKEASSGRIEPSPSAVTAKRSPAGTVAFTESSATLSSPAETPSAAPEPSASSLAVAKSSATPSPMPRETPASVLARRETPRTTPRPTLSPQPSALERGVAHKKKEPTSEPEERVAKKEPTRNARATPTAEGTEKAPRAKTATARTQLLPAAATTRQPPHQNFGDKVVRFLLYPFRHPKETTVNPARSRSVAGGSVSPTPSPPAQGRRKN